jgi:5-methylcytosine-specific restriction endonuclease McrA
MNCPNNPNCQLITIDGFVDSEAKRRHYIETYCSPENHIWEKCKRYLIHSRLHFCPDFVMPDTYLSIDKIIDRFDNEVSQ